MAAKKRAKKHGKRRTTRRRGALRGLGSTEREHLNEAQRSYESARADAKLAQRMLVEGRCSAAFTNIYESVKKWGASAAHSRSAGHGSMVSPDELYRAVAAFRTLCVPAGQARKRKMHR